MRGAVRSADKGTHLTQLFAPYGEKFEIVVVPDITVVRIRLLVYSLFSPDASLLSGGRV